MPSLLDMFQPQNAVGEPVSFGDALTGHSNSLVGLGMGLLSPYRPGESPYAAALQGFQAGSVADSRRGYQQAQLRHQKVQEARQAANDKFQREQAALDRDLRERQFARSGESDFAKVARDLNLQPGTPEYGEQARRYLQSKLEGDWSVQTDEETGQKFAYNKRTNETKPISVPGQTGTAAAPPPAINWSPDAKNAPVYGEGGSFAQPSVAPAATSTTVPDDAIPPAPPGSDRKEWKKEQTKLMVQRQIAAAAAKKAGASIDPVTEDIDRAINQTKQYPGMIAGGFGSLMKNIPGSQARDVAGLIDTIKANASLDKLQQMRASSPTGASGLGAVTQGEHKLLQDSIGALDQSQTPEQFLYNLDRVKRVRHEIIHGPGTAPPPQFQPPESQRTPAGAKPPPPKPGFVKGGYVFKGGDPADESNWAPVRK